MLTLEGTDIRRNEWSERFDHSGIAEYVWRRVILHGLEDESQFSESSGWWISLIGKRTMEGDIDGFITLVKYDNVAEAKRAYESKANTMINWSYGV